METDSKSVLRKSVAALRSALAAWFAAVQQLQNPVIAACIQMMLLTGARLGEVLALRWEDVNIQWRGISIRDKVEGTREIPATPYMLHLLAALARRTMTEPKTYAVRPLELLRLHHERLEAWMLAQAEIAFDAKAAPGGLRAVA